MRQLAHLVVYLNTLGTRLHSGRRRYANGPFAGIVFGTLLLAAANLVATLAGAKLFSLPFLYTVILVFAPLAVGSVMLGGLLEKEMAKIPRRAVPRHLPNIARLIGLIVILAVAWVSIFATLNSG